MADTAAVAHEPWVPASTFGTRLAMLRAEKGWNATQAAEVCGLSDESWRNWERGRSPRQMDQIAAQIAERTGVSLAWLLTGVQNWKMLSPVPDHPGQMELSFAGRPTLAGV